METASSIVTAKTDTWESVTYTFCPLVLQHINTENESSEWTLSFQQTPTPKIKLKGRMPTRSEMALVLINIVQGTWVIDLFMLLAKLAEKEE